MIAPVALPVPVSLPADSARSDERHGHHRRHGLVRQGVLLEQVLPQRARHHREHDIVERRGRGLGDPLDALDLPRLRGETARSADRAVEDRLGRARQRDVALADDLVGDLEASRHEAGDVARGPSPERTRASGSKPFLSPEDFSGRQRPRWQAVSSVRVLAERTLHEAQRRDAVDHRVVDLGVDRDTAVLQSLDDVDLPQRSLPVQQRAVPARGQLQQLADPPRARHGRMAYVVVVVDRLVGPPARADRLARALAEQRRDVVGLPVRLEHVPRELRTRPVRRHEQLQPADVHRMVAVLCQQEHRVRRRHERHR